LFTAKFCKLESFGYLFRMDQNNLYYNDTAP
jgi:hypothetical protein